MASATPREYIILREIIYHNILGDLQLSDYVV